MNNLVLDVQKQQIDSPLVNLFEIYLSDSTVLYFHPGLDEELNPIRFRDRKNPSQINTYMPMPMEVSGIEIASDGAQNRPTITVANVATTFRDSLGGLRNKDLVGKKVVRRQTLKKYLYTEEEDSNPPKEFPVKSFIIDRVSSENNLAVEFELSSPFDLNGIQIPNRVVIGKYCSWIYQGAEDGRGGCLWRKDSKIGIPDSSGNIKTHLVFYTADNEPIVDIGLISGAYNELTSYSKNTFVSYLGKYYYSKQNNNEGNIPNISPAYWGIAKAGTSWVPGTSYSIDEFVYYANTAWKCRYAHIATASNAPELGSSLWQRGDVCGKTLTSCKKRFQFVPSNKDINNSTPSVDLNTSISLPFGGFPGSAKFR